MLAVGVWVVADKRRAARRSTGVCRVDVSAEVRVNKASRLQGSKYNLALTEAALSSQIRRLLSGSVVGEVARGPS